MKWKEKIKSFIPFICLCFAIDGTIILIVTELTNGYEPPYNIVSFTLWCLQRYSILFITLFYKKYPPTLVNNSYLSINFQVLQWGILMITTYCIFLKSKFGLLFSFG